MPASREMRESEKKWQSIWAAIPNLVSILWYCSGGSGGKEMSQDVVSRVDNLIASLQEMVVLFKKEQNIE